jgi:hypothetical protein
MSYLGLIITLASMAGCSLTGGPRARAGHLPTDTHGIAFANPDKLGKHSYGVTLFEVGGIIYTCKAGHLDLGHIRGNADNTKYLVKKVRNALTKNNKGFGFTITGELSRHNIKFTYPANWESNPDKEKIINEIAYATGPYLSHQATVWHEILTWFGVHFMGFEQEFNSAFSWEDMYSNVLGTQLAVTAMKTPGKSFDQAMTDELNKKLKELNVQPKEVAIKASDKMRNIWYTGNLVPDMKIRNLDIGLDGYITPMMVPGITECSDTPVNIAVPSLKVLRSHGFEMTHQVSPNVLEQGKIYKAAGTKDIHPEKHYPIIMKAIKQQVIQKGYKYVE